MAVVTIGRLAEECIRLLNASDAPVAGVPTNEEMKIAINQVINSLLKVDYFSTNLRMGEAIPNGSVLGLYEGIAVTQANGKSKATLPVKPLKLPRNMGVYGIYPKYTTSGDYEYDKEFIPLQMGQGGLIRSQPLLNDLLGQVGYECFGDHIFFTKDIKQIYPDVVLAMRLAIMDVSEYGDWDVLPVNPEMEWTIKQEVVKMYSQVPVGDAVVDSTAKELKGVPINQQKQS